MTVKCTKDAVRFSVEAWVSDITAEQEREVLSITDDKRRCTLLEGVAYILNDNGKTVDKFTRVYDYPLG